MVHDHIWGELRHWAALESVVLAAAADVNQDLRDRIAAEYGVQALYSSVEEMLAHEELDIVQAASENSACADIVEACARRNIHVVSEKPMSATLDQARRMVAAATAAGTRLLINWPTAWNPAIQEMERLILSGAIGRVTYFKQRSAHNGPKEIGCDPHFVEWLYDEEKNGAGALMDYCGYSADMCARFLGRPDEVTGFRAVLAKDYPVPDDSAIILMRYPGAFGVAEASWTQTVDYATANPVVYGLEGSLAIQGSDVLLQKPGEETRVIAAPPTQAPRRNAPEYLLHCIETGEAIEGLCSMEVSLVAQEILEAGKRAGDTGVTQRLPLD